MNNQAPVHETIEQAISSLVDALGGAKKVAAALWADRPPEAAHRLLLACLNENRPERLNPHQLLTLMTAGRECGSHVLAEFMAAEAGYKFEALDQKDEIEKLQRQFADSVQMLAMLTPRIERLVPTTKGRK